MSVPSWLSGGRAADFFPDAGLRAVRLPEEGRFRVRTTERDAHRAPDLVVLDTLTTADQVRGRLGQMIGEQLVPDRVHADYGTRWRQAMAAMPAGVLDVKANFDAVTELLRLSQLRTHLAHPTALAGRSPRTPTS